MCKVNCDISKCHASCCYNVPMERAIFTVYRAHIQTPIIDFVDNGLTDKDGKTLVTPVTDRNFSKNKCPFLKSNCKCSIYERRPRICRIFGTPPKGDNSKFLRCGWLEGKAKDLMIENQGDIEDSLVDMFGLMLQGKI